MSDLEIVNAAIPAGETTSEPVAIGVKTIVGILMAPTWTGGALTFRVSSDGGATFLPFFGTYKSKRHNMPYGPAAGQCPNTASGHGGGY